LPNPKPCGLLTGALLHFRAASPPKRLSPEEQRRIDEALRIQREQNKAAQQARRERRAAQVAAATVIQVSSEVKLT